MSTAAESTMSGGNASTGDNSKLEQPSDAVPMAQMPQTDGVSSDAAAKHAAKHEAKDTPETSSSSDPPATISESVKSEQPEQGETSAAAAAPASSSKGKAKDDAPAPPSKENKDMPKHEKRESIMAIGPAQEDIRASAPGTTEDGSVACVITLLLASGGRHPYKIDAKYLSRRNVAIPGKDASGNPDPFSISIYTLKELILREWRSDWEAKPASPSSIRLIHFGKLLDDKEPLKKYQFSTENPNVVHMSIRPQDLDEEEPKTGSKNLPSGSGGGDGAREGRCCVIL